MEGFHKLSNGHLYRWTENSFTFFLYQELQEILIRYIRIILKASKDRLISKIGRQLVNFGANDFYFWLRVNEILLFQSGFVSWDPRPKFFRDLYIAKNQKLKEILIRYIRIISKWAWRAQFLSQTLQILEINLSIEAV